MNLDLSTDCSSKSMPECRSTSDRENEGGAMTTIEQGHAKTTKSPVDKKYRRIQWGARNVGTIALRHFTHNPAYELVGVLCNRPEKVGKDAGELCGKAPTGVIAPNHKA